MCVCGVDASNVLVYSVTFLRGNKLSYLNRIICIIDYNLKQKHFIFFILSFERKRVIKVENAENSCLQRKI